MRSFAMHVQKLSGLFQHIDEKLTAAYLHDTSLLQPAMVLGIHVSYAQGQAIDAQLQVAYPQRTAHLALDVLLKIHSSIGR